jgi:hypothetical protein
MRPSQPSSGGTVPSDGHPVGVRRPTPKGGARLSWRSIAIAIALSLAFGIYAGWPDSRSDAIVMSMAVAIPACAAIAFSMLIATVVADEWVDRHGHQLAAYACAVVSAAAVAALVQWPLQEIHPPGDDPWSPPDVRMVHTKFLFFESLIWGSVIVLVYVNRRNALRSAARMTAARASRVGMQHRLLESQLQALQARVEPHFLFDSLARVRELYERDPDDGSRALGDLIDYLRAALPHLREPTATVRDEVDLVSAYVAVVSARLDDRLVCSVDLSPATASARMPGMVLLPLVSFLLSARAAGTHFGILRITGRDAGDRMHLEITHGAATAAGVDTRCLTDVKERLRGLYADDWLLAIEPSAYEGTRAVLEIPSWTR